MDESYRPQRAALVASLGTCLSLFSFGCRSRTEVLWSTYVPSPQAGLTAHAEQKVGGAGFGTDYGWTVVTLEGTHTQARNFEVFELEGSGVDLRPTMRWTDAQHLDISYSGNPAVNLQVVQYGGITIDVQHVKEVR